MSKKSRQAKWGTRFEKSVNDHRLPRTVHQILRQRWVSNKILAGTARHVRAVWRDGDDGIRCFDCRDVPLHPWEPVLPRDEHGATL